MDLSVIIPMYNCEDTIIDVLSSVNDFIKKSDLEIEVLCIDDGSSDNTFNVVKNYAKDINIDITLIKKENEGISLTRNAGLKKSKGKHILFLDAEKLNDVIEKLTPNTELLYSSVGGLKWDTNIEITDNNQISKLYKDLINIGNYRIPTAVPFTIYLKDFLNKNNLTFDKKLRIGEDLLFNLQCLSHVQKIILTNINYYHLQESHSQFIFNKKNLKNELYFRKKSSQILLTCNENDSYIINQMLAVKGINFLVYQYFVPSILKKQNSFSKATKELHKICESKEYGTYIKSDDIDCHLSGREILARKLLSKKLYRLTMFCGIIINIIKPPRRYS